MTRPTRYAVGGPLPLDGAVVGTLARGTSSACFQGLAAVMPALHVSEHLSVTSLGVLLDAPTAGLIVTLLPWGWLTDPVCERLVLAAGLPGGGGAGARLRRHSAVAV